MKAKLEYCLRWLREGAVRVVRSYPVETLLALYACIRCLLTYELDWSEEELFNRLGLVPLFFALALAVNNLAGRGPWRKKEIPNVYERLRPDGYNPSGGMDMEASSSSGSGKRGGCAW